MWNGNKDNMHNSYKGIVKTTGLIAFVQIIQIFFGLIRNKVVAIVVGLNGFGIWSMYNTYIEMVSSFSSLGIDQSGVRQIAKHSDENMIAKCIWIFRRFLLLVSLLTTIISILFSKRISASLFGDDSYYWGIIIVSFVILCNGVTNGQKAIMNGLRNIKGLSISQIIGAIFGSVFCVILVFLLKEKGIPFYLLAVGLTAVLSTWWFVYKLKIKIVKPTKKEVKEELIQLIKLGLGFSSAGIIAAVMTYFSRIYLSTHYDLSMVGIYQASFIISNIYIGTILTAMGVDFMPRIMKLTGEHTALNKVTNEQIELGSLISSIGIIAIIIFSPLILQLLYSQEFIVCTSIIRWQILGVSLRVIAFPFSYIIMAKNKPFIYAIVQLIFWVTDYLLLIIFSNLFGFDGLGINYFVAYTLYLLMTLMACNKLCGFKFSKLALKIFCISYFFIITAWIISNYFIQYAYFIGTLLIIVAVFWINSYLKKYMQINLITFIKRKAQK
jgi:PST family polysaccharide transporter